MARSLLNPRDLRDEITRKKLNQLTGRPTTSVITTPITLTDADHIILVDDDTVGGAVTINLPLAANSTGNIYHIKKMGTTGVVTINPSGSETIDGATTLDIVFQYDAPEVYCDGTGWVLI